MIEIIRARAAKLLTSFTLALYFTYHKIFIAFAQADKIKQAFENANNDGNSFNTTHVENLTSNFLTWLNSWMTGLGAIVPVLTAVIVVAGLVIALVTSFSRRVRGFGLGISAFAAAIFLLWLFLPTMVNMFTV